MKIENEKSLIRITSEDEKFEIKVGRPIGSTLNLFFNFNIMGYLKFVDAIDRLTYLEGTGIQSYDDGTSGMAIMLTEENCLSQFIQDLPELLHDYVQKKEPTAVIRKGTLK